MKYTEKQISKMASPISQSEDEKCKNAIRMVRDAMKRLNYTDDGKDIRSYMAESYSYALDLRQQYTGKKITLLVQGSYGQYILGKPANGLGNRAIYQPAAS